MLKGGLLKRKKMRDDKLSDSNSVPPQELERAVFYRCTCPQCGNDFLKLRGFGQLDQSLFLGVTGEGTQGLGYDELDRDCNQALRCDVCGYSALLKGSHQSEGLLEWARSHGKQINGLGFTCPVCGSNELYQVDIGAEIHSVVETVYHNVDDPVGSNQALVALACDQDIIYGFDFRYRCFNGHELAKDDGTPVDTSEDLVEWLKACQSFDRG
jgi:predicted RNA-binding Zn-ribbon protein involved in translation (DUF1610 family)